MFRQKQPWDQLLCSVSWLLTDWQLHAPTPRCSPQSLYSWGGTAGASRRPRLTPLPDGVVSHALPQLSQLTYLQLGALHVPAASQLTCLSPTLQLLSLFDQDVPAGGLPSPPARADWPLLASYSADWDFSSGNWGGKHVSWAGWG